MLGGVCSAAAHRDTIRQQRIANIVAKGQAEAVQLRHSEAEGGDEGLHALGSQRIGNVEVQPVAGAGAGEAATLPDVAVHPVGCGVRAGAELGHLVAAGVQQVLAFQRKPVGRGRCAAAQAGLRPLGHTPPLGIIEILGVGRRAGRVLHRADPAFRIIEIRVAGVLDHVACSVVGEAR